jgi:hypothetical protein
MNTSPCVASVAIVLQYLHNVSADFPTVVVAVSVAFFLLSPSWLVEEEEEEEEEETGAVLLWLLLMLLFLYLHNTLAEEGNIFVL